jgi:hypothetical protein
LSAPEARRLRINLVRAAGLAAGLGLLMEGLLVLGGVTAATLASLLDKGLWPFLVCLAVALGQAVAGTSPPRAGAVTAVLSSLAFLLAKASQKAMVVLLDGVAPGAFVTATLLWDAALRGVEYAVLGAALVWLGNRPWAGALAYLGAGAVVGLTFGVGRAVLLPPPTLVGWLVTELVFPIGCALIIFASETLSKLLPEESASDAPAARAA